MQVWGLYSTCRILTGFTQLILPIWFSSLKIFASKEQMHKFDFGNVHQSPIPEDVYYLSYQEKSRKRLFREDVACPFEQSLSHYLRISHFKYCNK